MWQKFCKNKVVEFLASLKLAVCVILGFCVLMIWGTLTESTYNTAYAKILVYTSPIFLGVMVLLFINILFAALVRFPYKKRLTGFYIIHLGLLTILIGSAVTMFYGIDGHVRLFPNEPTESAVITDSLFYSMYFPENLHPLQFADPIPKKIREWNQPDKPFSHIMGYDIYIKRYLPFAIAQYSWKPHEDVNKKSRVLGLKLANANFNQSLELSDLNEMSQTQKLGPLTLGMSPFTSDDFRKKIKQEAPETPHVFFFKDNKIGFGKGNDWNFVILELHKDVELPWMGFKLTIDKIIDDKYLHAEWQEEPPYGAESERNSAAFVTVINPYDPVDATDLWVSDSEFAEMTTRSGFKFKFMIGNKIHKLPFALELEEFKMGTNPGTNDPASYESFVKVRGILDSETAHVYMNNPLKKGKFTFYQASYFPLEDGQTYGSVLSVNHDPGRFTKYLGSVFLICGTITHFLLSKKNEK